jgi:membrane protease YdiL (CAAX protease family)
LSATKLRNLSIFLLIALVAEIAHWGITALAWSLSIPYPTPSSIRGAFPTLDHNFYRSLFAETAGVVAGLLVLLASVALIYGDSLRYLISVDGRFRIGRFLLGLCVCLLPLTLFFVGEWSRHNVLYLGASWNRPEVWALALSAIGVQVFFEEYIFRGYLLAGLFTASRSYLFAAFLSSVVCGLLHQPDSPAAWAIPFVHGLLYCEFRRITGGIEFSSGYHFAWNLTSKTGVMPNFRWYEDSYGTLHFSNQVSGWSIGALLLGGLFILLLARFYPGEYTTRLLLPRKVTI